LPSLIARSFLSMVSPNGSITVPFLSRISAVSAFMENILNFVALYISFNTSMAAATPLPISNL
jgi:hypothetical protein